MYDIESKYVDYKYTPLFIIVINIKVNLWQIILLENYILFIIEFTTLEIICMYITVVHLILSHVAIYSVACH